MYQVKCCIINLAIWHLLLQLSTHSPSLEPAPCPPALTEVSSRWGQWGIKLWVTDSSDSSDLKT